MAKVKNTVSKALQQTVVEHPHIDKVHFDAVGRHHFNVHEYKSTEKGKGEDNGLYARISVQNMVDNNGRKIKVERPILNTKIVETVDRNDILEAEAVSDLSVNLGALSAEEAKAVEKMRQKISK